uniref:Adenylosuccinate lyase n=1 Tax=Candidatus Actinomarina minuta TaxID=1389454 RepID=S5DK60_9ACTN|nr:adenylosuccinate lyase [Candidatus Actinomarina minuta]AGQ19216.1 adenylosuccinate lyase [Candidatus Actinomarina minuta]
MIKRYLINEIEDIWNQNNKISTWKKVESSVTKQLEDAGIVPKGLSAEILKVNISLEELEEREKITNHDVASFVDILQNKIQKNSEWVHYGLTSSDIVDTSNSLLIIKSLDFLLIQIDELIETLKNLAIKEKDTKIIGRTHGVFAEITFLGNIFSNWLLEINRNKQRIVKAKENISVGKFSGAVGNYSILNQEIEEKALSSLNLKPELFASQIVGRDRYAEVIIAIGMLGSCFDRISQNLRGYQRSEVGEIFESFSKEQKGSSAMPHKKNPITSERVSGISRILRGYVITSLENISLWHERDISNSSVERIIFPDGFNLITFATIEMEKLFSNIQINHEKINSNIDLAKVSILTQACLSHLITKGVDRDEAYRFIQSQSFEFEDLDDYLTTLSKNFENVSIEELKSITNEILSEKTNENFEEKINSIV